MSRARTYVAVYERDPEDDAWNVHIKGIDGCQTYGRSLRQAQGRIREALAAWLDRDESDLVIHDQLPSGLSAIADRVSHARMVADRAGSTARRQTVEAIEQLTELGLSRRDAAELLGISHQRVQQLLQAG